ncbi:MAG: energy-coupling factor transporter transmembrane protein EcfT [Oscillospiraceae bacterium]|jgi:energy-coupling factor transport system permease protein|nr:energy-coupling factor transporter transmembrane protein EcfT [Oscillospiraceae bacterium]
MLKDITLGQYLPGNSVVHRIDPRFKLIITAVFMGMLFAAKDILGLALGGIFAMTAFGMSGISPRIMFKSFKPLLPLVLFTAVFDLFFIKGGEVWLNWYFIEITQEGVDVTVFMVLRILFLILGTSLLTYTTSPIVLTDAIERLFSPLKKLKLPVHEFALMMTIALRFIPPLLQETDKIMSAQKARGADFESGNLLKRVKSLTPVLIPLFVSAFMRAEELALAMTCRGYTGGEGRTRLRQIKSGVKDYAALTVTVLFFAAVIIIGNLQLL